MEVEDLGSTAGFSTASEKRTLRAAPREALPPLPTLTVLGHPDLSRIGDRVLLGELVRGREAFLSRLQPRFTAPGAERQGHALGDTYLSRRTLRLEPLPEGAVRLHVNGSRTPVIIDGVHLDDHHTMTRARLDDGVVLELSRRVVLLFHLLPRPPDVPPPRFGLVGDSAGMLQVRETIARVAELDVPVLLRGETGTGKELVACALHEHGPRREGRFVSVNLGALAPSLAAAELFGAKKGAFTGADRNRPGYFLTAHGGTLFLDEIGEAPPELQVMLLRVLETREVLPVGSQTPRPVDVRIVSATDVDLGRLVRAGGFRAPLLHRLMSYTLSLPPLRRRRDDVGRLLLHFLRRERSRAGEPPPPSAANASVPWLPASLVARLARYDWPGNVRQLRNVARQLVIDSRGRSTLDVGSGLDDLLGESYSRPLSPTAARAAAEDTASDVDTQEPFDVTPLKARWRKPSEVSEEELVAALGEHRFELKATARALGVSRTSLYALVERSPHVRSAADVPAAEIRAAYERHGGDLKAMVDELRVSERALRQRLKDLGLR